MGLTAPHRLRRAALAALALASALVIAPSARAQGEGAAALTLFEEGKKLATEGDFQQACPKLLASYNLVQKLGTLLNLADCYERSGRTASAWVRFTEATTMAERSSQQERAEYARSHAAALLPRLVRVTITVARPVAEGLVVRRDGALVDAAAFGTAVPVDPGTHTVEASAPHHHPWSTSLVIERDEQGEHAIAIPKLEPDAAAAVTVPIAPVESADPVEPPAGPAPRAGGAQRTWAYVAGGVGIASIASSLVVGLLASQRYDRSNEEGGCVNDRCSGRGLEDRSSASTMAGVSTGLFIGGAVLLGTGIVLYLTSPSRPALARTASW